MSSYVKHTTNNQLAGLMPAFFNREGISTCESTAMSEILHGTYVRTPLKIFSLKTPLPLLFIETKKLDNRAVCAKS